jgi:peptidyl-prolyl cis-trans isomerase C
MKIALITLAALALPLVLTAADPNAVATVNGVAIAKKDLELQKMWLTENLKRMGREVKDADKPMVEQQALDSLIEMELLSQEAKKLGVTVKPEEVAQKYEQFKKNFPKPEDFAQFLKNMDMTEEKLRKDTERELVVNAVMEKWFAALPAVTDADLEKYYNDNPAQFQQKERVKASHILVKVDEKATAEEKAAAKKKIEDIQAKLKAGGDFAALAKEYSDCPSKDRGGDLGFFGKGQMVPEFETAAFALKPGELSGIVETKFGYHLIKGAEHQQAGVTPLPEVKDRLKAFLENQKKRELLQKKLDELKKGAKIERFTGAPAASADPHAGHNH